jgi:hypothetical protein
MKRIQSEKLTSPILITPSLIFELSIFRFFMLFEIKLYFCTVLYVFHPFSPYRGYEARKSRLLLMSGLFDPILLNGHSA